MFTYIINKAGYEFIRNSLNEYHADSVNGEWNDGEFDTAIADVENDVNFLANGKAPEFCSDKPKFHMYACDTKTGQTMFLEMSWDMFDHQYYNIG